jgi:hypothetical protein
MLKRRLPFGLALCTLSGLAASATAQTNFIEVEPNDNKTLANQVVLTGPGDSIVGNTTGSTITGTGAVNSADYFLVRAPAAPLGIYRHRLTITSATPGHAGSIRGLTQSASGINPGTNAAAQSSSPTTNPPRYNQWYSFGRQEEIYYAITGTAATTADYAATFSSDPVVPTDLGTFQAGIIIITTDGQGHTTDTDLWIYDQQFNAIPDYGNDDLQGSTLFTSRLEREYTAGTYYLALSRHNLANEQQSPPDDRYRSGNVLDFPGSVLCSSTAIGDLTFSITDSMGPVLVPAAINEPFEVHWYRFTVTGTLPSGACCLSSGACSDLTEGQCSMQGGVFQGAGTTCATSPCPQPGACCFTSGGCMVMSLAECAATGGVFGGSATTCLVACGPLPTDKLVPPHAVAPANSWAYPVDYSQALEGTFNANAFRLVASAQAPGGSAWQSDAQMRLTAPSGITLLIGSGTPILWSNTTHLYSGTRPLGSGDPQEIDVIYLYDFGPVQGTWSVNFKNDWSSGVIQWNNIEIIPMSIQTGACCMPEGTCADLLEPACIAQGGIFQGSGSECASTPCPQPGACCFANGSCEILSSAQCAAVGGIYAGNGVDCQTANCAQPPLGACCMTDGSCTLMDVFQCAEATGLYRGDNTVCGQVPCPTVYFYSGGSVPIPDGLGANQCNTPAYVEIQVTENFTIDHVDAMFHILTTWQGDLVIGLEHVESSTSVALHSRPGSTTPTGLGYSADHFGTATTYFRSIDNAAHRYAPPPLGPVASPGITDVDGAWKPDNPLSAFHGLSSAGTWRLWAMDCYSGEPGSLERFRLALGGAPVCYANCDGSTTAPILNVEDFTCFINEFASGQALPYSQQVTHYANCDQSTTAPVLNVEDFTCFINKFAQGCN